MSNLTIKFSATADKARKTAEWLSPGDVFETITAIECIDEYMEAGDLRDEVVAGLREELQGMGLRARELCVSASRFLDGGEADVDQQEVLRKVLDVQQRNLNIIAKCFAGEFSSK
jgi:hypothetical protein